MDICNQKKYTSIEKGAIRKNWLQSAFAIMTLFFVAFIADAIWYGNMPVTHEYKVRIENQSGKTYRVSEKAVMIDLRLYLLAFLCLAYVLAYKRDGTKWLLFIIAIALILSVAHFVYTMIFLQGVVRLVPLMDTYTLSLDILLGIYKIILLFVSGYFISMSAKLYRINQTLKQENA